MAMFEDRRAAGRSLAQRLNHLRGSDVIVLGLPRGGVPVAYEVASALDAPLDVIVVRKLGVPANPEVAMGAIGEGAVEIVDRALMARAGVTPADLARVEAIERATLERRVAILRGGRRALDLQGRAVVIVDDGMATGATAQAACTVARRLGASHVIFAVPIAPPEAVWNLASADEVICISTPERFLSVGRHYHDFAPTTEHEVIDLLSAADAAQQRDQASLHGVTRDVEIPVPGVSLAGHLVLPPYARGVVVFAHGSGSSRHSPRNRYVAEAMHSAGLGTLLLDLLAPVEQHDRALAFDVELLSLRLGYAVRWIQGWPASRGLPVGLFGASTGAAAALRSAAAPSLRIAAVVSRGGRPDLADPWLADVHAPTLLIVGGNDREVLDLNREAAGKLAGPHDVLVIAGADHLFEEPGALEQVARAATDWFGHNLRTERAGLPAQGGSR